MKKQFTKIYENDFGNNEKIAVEISLSDDCKNGHNDFSITADIYEQRGSRYYHVSCGCQHDEILKYFPEFQIFVDLHICDDNGVPMYPIANNPYTGFFAVQKGQPIIKAIQSVLPELKLKAKRAIDLLCQWTGENYEQSKFSAHLFRETKCEY